VYRIYDYGSMIADRVRTDAYAQALRQVVTPESVVLDIGTGTGIWALLACQFGARQVYAIESTDAIQVAREIAAANGYAERIEFIQDMSTRVTLPEQADVIVSDMHGVLPLCEQNLPSLIDARRRLLVPGGTMIPQVETLWVGVVEAPELYHRHITPWDGNRYYLDMRPALRIMTNTWLRGRATTQQLLVEPRCWATLDYATLESPDVRGEVSCTATRAGIAHGLSVWFDATLAEGVCFSNAPGAPELIFGRPWSKPVIIAVGDTVSVALQANLVGDDYVWSWGTCILKQGHPGQIKVSFKQSTFFGVPLSPTRLRKRADSHVPTLNEDGQIDQFILALMDGETSLGQMASRVLERFPTRFAKWHDALTRVGDLSQKYSR
jgi:protein arginine N-methyltransferase 1